MSSGSRKVRIRSPLLAGLFYIIFIVVLGTLFISFLLSMSGIDENSLPYFAYPLHAIALFIGGWIAGKRARERGWYYGGLSGVIYAIVLMLIGFLGFDQSIGMDTLMILTISFGSSALGGMIGVNTAR